MFAISTSRSLHRLIYQSRQKIRAEDLDHEVGAIVRTAMDHNRASSRPSKARPSGS